MNARRHHDVGMSSPDSLSPHSTGAAGSLSLRAAGSADAAAVERLAALDSARAPRGEVMLVLADGRPVAALSLDDGHVVADPFRRTVEAVALLRLRAKQETRSAAAAGHRLGRPVVRAAL
jgi:hypothetical protein